MASTPLFSDLIALVNIASTPPWRMIEGAVTLAYERP